MDGNWTAAPRAFEPSSNASDNITDSDTPPEFPLSFRVIATTLHSIIFFLGFFGNILVVLVVRKTSSLHVPTYSYLVTLAVADLVVLVATIPEQLVAYQLYAGQWILGHFGCSLLVFLSFLGINASSISILAFTIERFIAICMPMRAKSICTMERAKKINAVLWIISLLSACPWLGLTILVRNPNYPTIEQCSFRLSRQQYAYIFGSDIIIFYLIPLLTASVLYVKIALKLRVPQSQNEIQASLELEKPSGAEKKAKRKHRLSLRVPRTASGNGLSGSNSGGSTNGHANGRAAERGKLILSNALPTETVIELRRSRMKVVWMLIVVMLSFAILWLPYRALSLYNTFSQKPYLNKWFMLFCRTCIFINSSINPILYNAMSERFRHATLRVLRCTKTPRTKSTFQSVPTGSVRIRQHSPNGRATLRPGSCASFATPLPTPTPELKHSPRPLSPSELSGHYEVAV